MITALSSLHAFRNVERTYTKTETGGQINFQRSLANDQTITGQTNMIKNENGGVTVNISATGPNGNTKSVERTFTPEQIDAVKTRLNTLGQNLAENPVTLPNGKVADGSFLLRITA
jgi:hypothetical protein